MTKYKIAYIDESEADIRRFQRFSYNYFEVIPFIPKNTIEETCNDILESDVDAIVSDFEFSEQLSTVHYDGTNLVCVFLKKREDFPVFIFTNYFEEAISKAENVNLIYEKKIMGEGAKGGKFLERVKVQIEKYKNKLEIEENRLLELIAESKKRKLDAFEKQELIELDSKIGTALNKQSRISNIFREDKEATDLTQILKKVNELSKLIDKKLN